MKTKKGKRAKRWGNVKIDEHIEKEEGKEDARFEDAIADNVCVNRKDGEEESKIKDSKGGIE